MGVKHRPSAAAVPVAVVAAPQPPRHFRQRRRLQRLLPGRWPPPKRLLLLAVKAASHPAVRRRGSNSAPRHPLRRWSLSTCWSRRSRGKPGVPLVLHHGTGTLVRVGRRPRLQLGRWLLLLRWRLLRLLKHGHVTLHCRGGGLALEPRPVRSRIPSLLELGRRRRWRPAHAWFGRRGCRHVIGQRLPSQLRGVQAGQIQPGRWRASPAWRQLLLARPPVRQGGGGGRRRQLLETVRGGQRPGHGCRPGSGAAADRAAAVARQRMVAVHL